MGGGGDSRIPSILKEHLSPRRILVVCRTYSFDPDQAQIQIRSWVEELSPDLIVGESLGALHALRIKGVSKLFVSPALNAPIYFEILAWLSLIPGVTLIFDRLYRPKEGDRQSLHFTFGVLRKYMRHRRAALSVSDGVWPSDLFHAFFGTRDHYRRSGIVSLKTWEKHFGKTYDLYEGTHFMEDEHVISLLCSEIVNALKNK